MKLPNQQNSSRKLVSYLGILSASVLVSLPALALITPNSTNFNNSSRLDTTIRNGQFLAQNSTGITAPNRSSTGGTQQNPTGTNNFPANGTGTIQQTPTGTNNFPANGTGTTQQTPTGTNNFPANGTGTIQQTPTGT
ncbi:MAG TPA: hypothetical protein DCL61_05460, partial [Cyanobacteria bacterium UBA12227]|nr:hypothetical protein [Cyanobacteria bacterium UBA12227]HAX89540.1 hypothetical protein [Cyanobacteria bacterium UBA11370]HBY79134.1 hypothetical protein [Cyanobacteria bacterium UBA11148]